MKKSLDIIFSPEEVLLAGSLKRDKDLTEIMEKYPISLEIDMTYKRLTEKYQEKEVVDEDLRKKILDQIEILEQIYRKKTDQLKKDRDWVTIEIFPGAKEYYRELIGTKRGAEVIRQHPHYLERFMQIEDKLGGE